MVEHGRVKKARRGLKVSRKQPKPLEKRIKGCVKNPIVKAVFDARLSIHENISKLGLSEDVNQLNAFCGSSLSGPAHPAFVGYIETAAAAALQEAVKPRKAISDFDFEYMSQMNTKYGTDFRAMSKDLQLNTMQHTEAHLRKLWTNYCTEQYRQLEKAL